MLAELVFAASALVVPLDCGDRKAALEALEARRAGLVPPLSFAEVRARVGDPMVVKEYWGTPPRELEWLLTGSAGRRTVHQVVVCQFDATDTLVGCQPFGEPFDAQYVEWLTWDSLPAGATRAEVVTALCQPEAEDAYPDKRLRLTYTVRMPERRIHGGTCVGQLILRKGRLAAKHLECR